MINKTVKGVFDKAIYLINENNENTGATMSNDTTEYRVRTIGILNTLIDEVYAASSTYHPTEDGTRPALDDLVSFDDEIDLDAFVIRSVLPYGLSARLLSEENPTLANYFQQIYEENLARGALQIPKEFESIKDEYGVIF